MAIDTKKAPSQIEFVFHLLAEFYRLGRAGKDTFFTIRGADTAIKILREEVDSTLALLGRPTLSSLDRTALMDLEKVKALALDRVKT